MESRTFRAAIFAVEDDSPAIAALTDNLVRFKLRQWCEDFTHGYHDWVACYAGGQASVVKVFAAATTDQLSLARGNRSLKKAVAAQRTIAIDQQHSPIAEQMGNCAL